MEKVVVDKNINIFKGKKADELLTSSNDKKFIKDGLVKKVSLNRWNEAQDFEKKTWCDSPAKGMQTDRNEDHYAKFGNYLSLSFNLPPNYKAIELGCGPFTNLRIIIPSINPKPSKIDLLDPLAKDYVKDTTWCQFKSGILAGRKIDNIFNLAIEDFVPTEKYDLVVMINVLEHCRDIDNIFEKIDLMLNKEGLLVFHDISTDDSMIVEILENRFDAGHPIILSHSYMKKIKSQFKTLYSYTEKSNNKEYATTNHYLILKK